MGRRFFELAFTPAVKAVQSRRGSRETYARVDDRRAPPADLELGPREIAFLGSRDSFYLASVSETGWPYIQHRGGPRGFVRVVDARTIGWAEFRGNRQYITTGNVSNNDRVALFFMDYAARRRLKLLGRMQVAEASSRPELAHAPNPGAATVEAWALVRLEAYDWNCPQYITPRYTAEEFAAAPHAGPEGVARDTGQPKAAVDAIVRGVLARIERAIGKGETVNIVGFGRFEVYKRSARRGRNLQPGESLKIPATRAVRFKIGKRLRDAAAGSKRKRGGKSKK